MKKAKLEKDRESLLNTIEELDEKKKEAINKAWVKVNTVSIVAIALACFGLNFSMNM